MRAIVLSIALTFATGASAQAQQALRLFYPAAAQEQGIGGQVTVECLVGEDGRLTCEAIEETPANMGFGAAALRMVEDWRIAPRTRDGVPTAGGRVRRTFVFEPGPPPTVTSAAPQQR
jgi:TonB family protein